MGDGAFDAWWAGWVARHGYHWMPGEANARVAWAAAVAAERERCAAVAVAEVWGAAEAEGKAMSKGSAAYTHEFRAANLAERIAAVIREGGVA